MTKSPFPNTDLKNLCYAAADRLDSFHDYVRLRGATPPTTTLQVELRHLGDFLEKLTPIPTVTQTAPPVFSILFIGILLGITLGLFLY